LPADSAGSVGLQSHASTDTPFPSLQKIQIT
jgi:hypothetical protein